jgi:Domain of unknown function (DUF4397)
MGRTTLSRQLRLSGLCLLAFFFAECGSSSNSTTANLRIMQASPDAPASKVLIDNSTAASTFVYGNTTDYTSVKVGSRHIQVLPVSGGSAVFDQSVSVSSDAHQTLILTGLSSAIQPVMLTDGGTTSTTGDGYVRVFNASSSLTADVYIVPAGSSIVGVTPVTKSTPLAFDKDTGYQLTAIGNYEVLLTAPGTVPPNVFIDTGPIALTQGQNQTVVALDATSGGFTYNVLADQ